MLEPTIGLKPLTSAKYIAAKDFNQFPPGRKGVLAMLITLVLGATG